jgi:DNA-binding response OmpR family regulator
MFVCRLVDARLCPAERMGKLPLWLPDTHIQFVLEDYGMYQLIGVIKARVQEHGGGIQSGAELLAATPQLFGDSDLGRTRPKRASLLRCGDVELDVKRRKVRQRERYLHLGPKEFELLEFFMKKPGQVFSRQQLINAVWGSCACIDERTVDVHVGRLRRAFRAVGGHDPIRTVRGSGYAFEEDQQHAHE